MQEERAYRAAEERRLAAEEAAEREEPPADWRCEACCQGSLPDAPVRRCACLIRAGVGSSLSCLVHAGVGSSLSCLNLTVEVYTFNRKIEKESCQGSLRTGVHY